MKQRVIIAVVLMVAVALIPSVWSVAGDEDKADDNPWQPRHVIASTPDLLRGLQGVCVIVERPKLRVEQLGLTKEALQTDTELQLRQYGIKVLSKEEAAPSRGPCLVVTVNSSGEDDEGYPVVGLALIAELRETVYLLRNPTTICLGATTWSKGMTQRVMRNDLRSVRDTVKDLVAVFINDYLAANPRESEAEARTRD